MSVQAWVVTEKCPKHLLAEIRAAMKVGDVALAKVLANAHVMGWIRLLGVAKGSLEDAKAVLQEHFELRDITKEPARERQHGRKKRLE